jgi:hypothetical protein
MRAEPDVWHRLHERDQQGQPVQGGVSHAAASHQPKLCAHGAQQAAGSSFISTSKAETLNYSQVAGQRAMEALPLVMEPESRMCIPFDAFS